MKVFQINTVSGYGSTGSICVDLAEVLIREGHSCTIAYGQGTTKYPDAYKIGTRFENHLHNVLSRITGKQGYFSQIGTRKLIRRIKAEQPDVIHLHNLHGNYLNFKSLFSYLSNAGIPIVWTLHDCWAYTGKCAHYTDVACFKWKSECSQCPQVRKYPASIWLDRSRSSFYDKRGYFTAIKDMTVIPVSKWLASQASFSFLNKYPIQPIYNWVDHETFNPNQIDVRSDYSISASEFIILVVSASWSESDAKYQGLIKLVSRLDPKMKLLMVGKLNDIKKLPKDIIHIPYLDGKHEMAKVYAAADVYVHLSTEDTFGKVIAESLSCGTPAVVYNSTACPEIVGEGCGYIVDTNNIDQMMNAIKIIQNEGKSSYSLKCRKFVLETFDYERLTQKTIDLYKKMISNDF